MCLFHFSVYVPYQGNDIIFGYLGLSKSTLLNNLHHLKDRLAKFPWFSSINSVKEMRQIHKVTEFREWSQRAFPLKGIIKTSF